MVRLMFLGRRNTLQRVQERQPRHITAVTRTPAAKLDGASPVLERDNRLDVLVRAHTLILARLEPRAVRFRLSHCQVSVLRAPAHARLCPGRGA